MAWLSRNSLSLMLVGLCTLMLLVAPIEDLAWSFVPSLSAEASELGFVPRSRTLLIFENGSKNEPLPLRPVVVMSGLAAYALAADSDQHVGQPPERTSLPTDYRLFFLIPVFNSKFKDAIH